MKIRLAILDADKNYLNRMVSVFNVKYADKLEIYSFTNAEAMFDVIESAKIDVLLVSEEFDIDVKRIPEKCGFAYLVESKEMETLNEQIVICKYQKADMIYKQILCIFSDKTSIITGISADENQKGKVISFMSAAGGCGSSTAAVACAVNFARKGKKVFYLNLEQYGSADVFFKGEGKGTLGDIIFAIKSKKGNMSLKIESTVRTDETGVDFFAASPLALDVAELQIDEIKQLITDLRVYGEYDYVILDVDFSLDKDAIELLKICNNIVLVVDGSAVSNAKTQRMIKALSIVEELNDMKILLKSCILYNRFSSQTSEKLEVNDIKEIGGIKRYEGFNIAQMLKELAGLSVFDSLA